MKAVPIALLALCASLPLATLAAEEHVGRDAEKGDPARWYEPADTPQEKYATAMQEAKAALAEWLKECRGGDPGGRKACEAEARAQFRADSERARAFLARPDAG
jgi:hypothetical protein